MIYLDPLIEQFKIHSNIAEAKGMEKYMRHQFPFFGIKKPLRESLVKEHITSFGFPDEEDINALVLKYWNYPQREIQYVLQGILSKRKRKFLIENIVTFEFMLLNGSWWDTVDYIAGDLVGSYFMTYPKEIDSWTEKWMKSGNFWLQRTCILYQLKYKDQTDNVRLERFILPCSQSDEFFLQKAIGWALRQYSKTNAEWVSSFIATNNLKPLSVREGMKWIKKVQADSLLKKMNV